MATLRVVLDADVGIDDALMLLYLAAEPGVEIVALGSTHGNCSAAQAAHNALRVLHAIGRDDVPVAIGIESPMPNATHSAHVHGNDGLADAGVPDSGRQPIGEGAVDQLLRLGRDRPGELDLIAVGAMTNLALALAEDEDALRRYRSVTLLGGISREPGADEPEYYDANVFHNPAAADALFASGTPTTVTPIDLSYRAALSDEHLAAIRAGSTPQARLAWRILPFYCDFYQGRLGRWSACMHDPLAAGIAIDPSLVMETVERPLVVEPYLERHRAIARLDRPDRPPQRIVVEADRARFLDRFVAALVTPLGELPSR